MKHYRKRMSAIREPRNSMGITKTRLINKLIRLYHANECLWNPKSPGYHNLALKDKAWQRISGFFKDDNLSIEQLKLMIISLRYYYERERLAIMTNRLNGVCYAPRHSYYDKLHFLNPDSDPLNILTNSNKQMNRIVEDTFLVGNNQNCIHNENNGLPFRVNEDNFGQDLSGKVTYRFGLPLPPLEIKRSRLQYRSVSGCDRSRSQMNFNIANDDNNSQNGKKRTLPPTFDDQSTNHCFCFGVHGERCDLPAQYKRKGLAGNCMLNSRGKFNRENQQTRLNCGSELNNICGNRCPHSSSGTKNHFSSRTLNWSPGVVDNQQQPQYNQQPYFQENSLQVCSNSNCEYRTPKTIAESQQQPQYNQQQQPQYNQQQQLQYNQQQYNQQYNQQQYNQQYSICNNPNCEYRTPQPIVESQQQPQYDDLQRQYDQSVNKQAQNDNRSGEQYVQSKQSSYNSASNSDKDCTGQCRNNRDRVKDDSKYENSARNSGSLKEYPSRDAKRTNRSNKTPSRVEYIYCPTRQRDSVRDPNKPVYKNRTEFRDPRESNRRENSRNECKCGQECNCHRKIIIYCAKRPKPNFNSIQDYDEYPDTKPIEYYQNDRDFDDVADMGQKVYSTKNWSPTEQYYECPCLSQTEAAPVNDPKNVCGESPSVKRAKKCLSNEDIEDSRYYYDYEQEKYCECNNFEEYPDIMPYDNDCCYESEVTPEIKLYCGVDGWEESRDKRSDVSGGTPDDVEADATNYENSQGNRLAGPQYNEASVETELDMTLRCRNKQSCVSNCILSCKEGSQNQEKGAEVVPEYSDSCVETEIDMTLNCRNKDCPCEKTEMPIKQTNKKPEEIRKESPKSRKGNPIAPIDKPKSSFSSKKLKPICKCASPVYDKTTNKSRPASPNPKQRSASSGPTKYCVRPSRKADDVSAFQKTGNLVSGCRDKQEGPTTSKRNQSFSISPHQANNMFFPANKFGSQRTSASISPFRNLSLNASKRDVIMLHPPVKNFRPSKYSIDLREQFSYEDEIDL